MTLGFGLLLLWTFVGHRRGPVPDSGAGLAHYRELLTAAGAAWALAWTWIFGAERAALAFSPAEVAFLLPAPIRRRSLIQFKLLHAQGRILGNTLLWTLLLSANSFGAHAWMRAVAAWVLLSTLSLHRLGASFVRHSLWEHGAAGFRRRIPTLIVLAGVASLVIAIAAQDLPALVQASRGGGLALLAALNSASERPLPALLLFPFRVLVRPIVAHDISSWARALGPALLVLLAHFVWVLRSDTAFEEAAAEESFRRASAAMGGTAAALPAPGAQLSGPPFLLAATGWPATAIYWKNLIAAARARRIRNTVLAAGGTAALLAFLSIRRTGPLPSIIGALAATWAALSLVMGPQWVRNDLRTDLARLELLRSYPLRGAAIVAAETAAAATVLTAVQVMLIVFAYSATLGDPGMELTLAGRTALLAGAVVVLPFVNYAGLLLQNGAALLYPAWVRIGPGRSTGVEGLGQNMLGMLAYAVALLVMLLVPGGAAVGVWLVLRPIAAGAAVVAAIGAGVGLLAVESWLLVRPLGRVFERIDITAAGISRD